MGNPFRPVVLRHSWLHFNSGTVSCLAAAIAAEGNFDDLPILGDALEDAGCTNAAVLEHCRAPGPHVRGCWVLNAVLGQSTRE